MDGWRAIHAAKAHGWIDFQQEEVDIDRCIDIQEYLHYDSPVNGVLHVIIPSELIAFQCPADLLAYRPATDARCCKWLDVGGKRMFGAAYYADILGEDFEVELVVRSDASLDDSDDTSNDDSAFEEQDIGVERLACLGLDGSLPNRALLHDVDRFLTLARLAPGPVAIYGRQGTRLGGGGEVLVSSLLMQRHGFDSRSALAWLRVCHPPAPPRVLAFSLLDDCGEPALDTAGARRAAAAAGVAGGGAVRGLGAGAHADRRGQGRDAGRRDAEQIVPGQAVPGGAAGGREQLFGPAARVGQSGLSLGRESSRGKHGGMSRMTTSR